MTELNDTQLAGVALDSGEPVRGRTTIIARASSVFGAIGFFMPRVCVDNFIVESLKVGSEEVSHLLLPRSIYMMGGQTRHFDKPVPISTHQDITITVRNNERREIRFIGVLLGKVIEAGVSS